MSIAKRVIIQTVSVAILALGFAQFSVAGVISSADVVNAEVRDARISRIEAVLARADVAEQLQQYGVSADFVAERVQNMTDSELLQLENGIEGQIAGGDVVGVIGVVFIVLMILELVGVTDIFKSF